MNCEELRDAILAGKSATDPDIARHLEECEVCAEMFGGERIDGLLREAATGPVSLTPPTLGGPLDRVRSMRTPVRFAMAISAVLLIGGLNAVSLLRTDAVAYPGVRMGITLAALALSAMFIIAFVLRPVHLPRPDPRWLPGLVAGGLVLTIFFCILPEAHHQVMAHPESFKGQGDDFWPRAIGCLIYGCVMGFPTLALLWLVGRGGPSRSTALLGGLTAMALSGNVALQLHCPLVSVSHLLVGHLGVPVVLLSIGLPIALRWPRAG